MDYFVFMFDYFYFTESDWIQCLVNSKMEPFSDDKNRQQWEIKNLLVVQSYCDMILTRTGLCRCWE